MSAEQEAFENLQRFATQFAGILKIAPDLQQLGSLKGAIAEAEGRLAAIKEQEASLPGRIAKAAEDAKSDVAKIKSSAAVAAAAVRDEAQRILADAQMQANATRVTAADEGKNYLGRVKASALDHETRITTAQATLAEIEQKRAAALSDIEAGKRDREMVDAYQKQVADAKSALGEIEQRKTSVLAEIEQLGKTLADKQTAHDRISAALSEVAGKLGIR